MTRSRPITFLAGAAVVPLVALALAACGGGGAAATAAPPPAASTATSTTTPARTATVRVAKSSLGSILVDGSGRTLYLFRADSGAMSACAGACAAAWPPLLAGGIPTAGTGVDASEVGTITRAGGARQVTYNGHPLYLFVKDVKPGQTAGQGVTAFGAAWFAVSPAGGQISTDAKGHGSGSASSSPAPAAPSAAKAQPAPKAAPPPAPKSAPKPAPPVAKPAPPANSGIPQNNGGDGDSDNNGGPSDGDGNI